MLHPCIPHPQLIYALSELSQGFQHQDTQNSNLRGTSHGMLMRVWMRNTERTLRAPWWTAMLSQWGSPPTNHPPPCPAYRAWTVRTTQRKTGTQYYRTSSMKKMTLLDPWYLHPRDSEARVMPRVGRYPSQSLRTAEPPEWPPQVLNLQSPPAGAVPVAVRTGKAPPPTPDVPAPLLVDHDRRASPINCDLSNLFSCILFSARVESGVRYFFIRQVMWSAASIKL